MICSILVYTVIFPFSDLAFFWLLVDHRENL